MKKIFLSLTLMVSIFFVGLMGPKADTVLDNIAEGVRNSEYFSSYNAMPGYTFIVSSSDDKLTFDLKYNGNGDAINVDGTKVEAASTVVEFPYSNGILSYSGSESDPVEKNLVSLIAISSILDSEMKIKGLDSYYVDFSDSLKNATLEKDGIVLKINVGMPTSNDEDIFSQLFDMISKMYVTEFKLNVNDFKLLNNYVQKVDSSTNIGLYTNVNILASDVAMTIKKVDENDKVYTDIKSKANKRLNDLVSKVTVYDINLEKNGSKIQPNGEVTLAFPVPSGYNTVKMMVYRMEEDGSLTAIPFKVENNKIQITTNHFSNYALVEVNYDGLVADLDCPEEETISPNPETVVENPETGNGLQYGVLGLITLSCIGAYIYAKKYNKFPSMK